MLGADEGVAATLGLDGRRLQTALEAGGNVAGAVRRGARLTGEGGFQSLRRGPGINAQLRDGCCDEALWLAQEREQQVVDVQGRMAQTDGGLLGTAQGLARLIGETFWRDHEWQTPQAPERLGPPDLLMRL